MNGSDSPFSHRHFLSSKNRNYFSSAFKFEFSVINRFNLIFENCATISRACCIYILSENKSGFKE